MLLGNKEVREGDNERKSKESKSKIGKKRKGRRIDGKAEGSEEKTERHQVFKINY